MTARRPTLHFEFDLLLLKRQLRFYAGPAFGLLDPDTSFTFFPLTLLLSLVSPLIFLTALPVEFLLALSLRSFGSLLLGLLTSETSLPCLHDSLVLNVPKALKRNKN